MTAHPSDPRAPEPLAPEPLASDPPASDQVAPEQVKAAAPGRVGGFESRYPFSQQQVVARIFDRLVEVR